MASSKAFLQFILEELSDLEEITHRAMMGEFILYYRGKIIGGIYDNRLLLKPTTSVHTLLPDASLVSPYPGAKEMLAVEDVENRALLEETIKAMYDELPTPKPKKKK